MKKLLLTALTVVALGSIQAGGIDKTISQTSKSATPLAAVKNTLTTLLQQEQSGSGDVKEGSGKMNAIKACLDSVTDALQDQAAN